MVNRFLKLAIFSFSGLLFCAESQISDRRALKTYPSRFANLVSKIMRNSFNEVFNVEERWKTNIAKECEDAENEVYKSLGFNKDNLSEELEQKAEAKAIKWAHNSMEKYYEVDERDKAFALEIAKKYGFSINDLSLVYSKSYASAFSQYPNIIGMKTIGNIESEKASNWHQFCILHELAHLYYKHGKIRTRFCVIIEKMLYKNKPDPGQEFNLRRLHEKQADIEAATKELHLTRVAAQKFQKQCVRAPHIRFEDHDDPHPHRCVRAAYLLKIYQEMLARETVKNLLFRNDGYKQFLN